MIPGAHSNIVTAAASGDDEALTLLVRAYHNRVYRFGRRVCRDDFDADDAVQEAFVALARRPDVARHSGALSWLMTTVRNACLRMLRPFLRDRRLGELAGASEEVASPLLDPQQALERWELMQSVHAAIAALPRPYREVVVMRDLEGLSGEETCQALGLEPAAMKTRLHRARQQIRELMDQSKRAAERNHN
ncbi:MAG TPA: sigma-70 family RNA polymerase sigma factor [Polyangiaceae bacterium]|nr:sigma-70 family RNA polymerase sigma factor [Polyangiaceae bacterium]